MNKLLVFSLLGVLLGGCTYIVFYNNLEEDNKNMENVYQGPVPQGYDLDHFVKTGETIKKIIVKNPRTGETWNSIEEYRNRKLDFNMGVKE